MNDNQEPEITDRWILSSRGPKNSVDPLKPYAWCVEKERTSSGTVEDVLTVFLTNRECPFHCLMCDLWKNTTDKTVPEGAIPQQVEWVLNKNPEVSHIKLYNSGSFFDDKAIPQKDHRRIAAILKGFKTVIVESHPRFITKECLFFRDLLEPQLQIAIGLETVDTTVISKLNKRMDPEDFRRSVTFLSEYQVPVRAFILLKPPFQTEEEGLYWTQKSTEFAFECGAECSVIIPVRAGNGAMDHLKQTGFYSPPKISSLEKALEYGINMGKGRVFADTWDLKLFSDCDSCFEERLKRITEMNLSQRVPPFSMP